ncbi:ubiquitin-protein transferase [Aureococcus anophagefferens]|uniref:Ubiquitin-protein transferase n=1 Tax=Aureococcus anophagefferens TaxID=44056 RepID=A0ABR1FGH8_AURAN
MAEIEGLVRALREGDDADKAVAARALHKTAHNSDANRVLIAEAGGIPPLVELVRDGSAEAKQVAMGTLENLACNDANKVAIAEAGGIAPLVELLRDGSAEAKEEAAWLLFYLAGDNNGGNKVLIVEAGGIAPLVEILRNGPRNAIHPAAIALEGIAVFNDANAVAIAAAVGLEALVQLARRGRVTVESGCEWLIVPGVGDVTVNEQLVLPAGTGIAAKRKAALVVSALLRACVPVEARSQVRDLIRSVIGAFL